MTSFGFTQHGLNLVGEPAWGYDNTLLFDTVQQAGRAHAILRLVPDGTVDRATPVSTRGAPYVFPTRP